MLFDCPVFVGILITPVLSIQELQKLWSEHQDLDGDKLPVSKVADVYWSVGYILGPTYTPKLEEELKDAYGT